VATLILAIPTLLVVYVYRDEQRSPQVEAFRSTVPYTIIHRSSPPTSHRASIDVLILVSTTSTSKSRDRSRDRAYMVMVAIISSVYYVIKGL